MKHTANSRFQLVTFYFDSGMDSKQEYAKIAQAIRAKEMYYPDCDGYGIWDHWKKAYVRKVGVFPA